MLLFTPLDSYGKKDGLIKQDLLVFFTIIERGVGIFSGEKPFIFLLPA